MHDMWRFFVVYVYYFNKYTVSAFDILYYISNVREYTAHTHTHVDTHVHMIVLYVHIYITNVRSDPQLHAATPEAARASPATDDMNPKASVEQEVG